MPSQSIRVSLDTKDRLEKLKIHKNQSYSEVIEILIKNKEMKDKKQ